MSELYTVRDLTKLFRRHENTVYRWLEERLFPNAFRVKDGWFIPAKDVKRLMKMGRPEQPPSVRPKKNSGSATFLTG